MKIDLDSRAITLTCPKCKKKIDEKIGRLKNKLKTTCPKCREIVLIDANEFRKGADAVQKQLDALGKALGKLGK